MINIRKILLLSALLISASSITAPTYATIDDEGDVVQAPRTIHAKLPLQLTPDMISEIRQHGSFSTIAKEYVLLNPDQLDKSAKFLNSDRYSPFTRMPIVSVGYGDLYYYFSRRLNPDYDPKRPDETGTEFIWIEDEHLEEGSRLIFQEQDRAFVPEPVATTSIQVPLSIAPSFVNYSSIAADLNS